MNDYDQITLNEAFFLGATFTGSFCFLLGYIVAKVLG